MKTAAIYCRVSTEDQEREGSSLDSQREACLLKAKEMGYETSEDDISLETYSGLSLERPKLDQIRQLVRDKQVDIVIAYTLDRLSRDPVHCIILQDEFEKNGAELVLATETIDTSDMGKLITHIKGFAAKLEAEKIRERTMRGKKTKAQLGRIVGGSHARLYGYNYIKVDRDNGGRRVINEEQAKWVIEIFRWLVEERLSIYAITCRLRALNIPNPSGEGYWLRSTVHKILRNFAYIGKTYAFTQTHCVPQHHRKAHVKNKKSGLLHRPREEWIEIPDVTPRIIDDSIFEMAQQQLQKNREFSRRNAKNSYLLHGLVSCKRCGRTYRGYTVVKTRQYGRYECRRYRCAGSQKIVTPIKCFNSDYNADEIEHLVWERVEEVLTQPEFVLSELARQQQDAQQSNTIESDLSNFKGRLTELDKEQERLLEHSLMGFPEELVKKQNKVINEQRQQLLELQKELENQVQSKQQCQSNLGNIETFCHLIKENIKLLSFDNKRLALEALQIKVWVDDNNVEITGSIPMDDIATTQSGYKHRRIRSCPCLWWRRRRCGC